MASEPKNEAIEFIRRKVIILAAHMDNVTLKTVYEWLDEAAAKYPPQPAVTCEQIEDATKGFYGGCGAFMARVKPLFASAATPARKTISIPEARNIALDAVAKAEQERAAERLAESPAEEPTPPSPAAEVKWPTEPGLWERLDSGNVYVAYKDRRCKDIVIVQLAKPPHWEMHEGAVDSKWRRVPAAADVELAARQQECERLRRAMDQTDESCSRSIGRLTARIAELERQLGDSQVENVSLVGRIHLQYQQMDAKAQAWDKLRAELNDASPLTSEGYYAEHVVERMDSLLAPAAEGGGA